MDESFDELELEIERYELREPTRFRFETDRRRFMQATGTGLMLAVAIKPRRVEAQRGTARRDEYLNERFFLAQDGTITVFTSKVEVGQGSRTQLTQAAAEELRLNVDQISLVMADTQLCPNDGGTAGSRTTPSTVPRIRAAAATLRETLINHVAKQTLSQPEQIQYAGGIFRSQDGQEMTLGQLASDQSLVDALKRTSLAEGSTVIPVADWQVLGTPVPKLTSRAVVTGAMQYPSDTVLPGMWYGKVVRPVSYGASLTSIDLDAARDMTDVVVVRDGDFIGCVAATSYEAALARDAIAASAAWNRPNHPASVDLFTHLRRNITSPGTPRKQGDFLYAWTGATKRFDASYKISYIQHAPMEPRAAVAQWNGDLVTVWTGTQQPDRVRSELIGAFQLPAESVRVIVPDTGGGFGGKHTGECAVEAARLAKAAGRPVSLRWTREEEFTWAYFRPAGVIDIRAALDSSGNLIGWEFTNYNSGGSAIESPYRIPTTVTRTAQCEYPLRQGSYRALASTANVFARESAMDELAAMAQSDPLEFRLKHLDEGRLKDVLRAAARNFDWSGAVSSRLPNRGVGIACGTEKGSFVAACAEVEVTQGEPRVLRICQAYECGAIQNPANLRLQVEGALVQGLGGALYEAVEFSKGQITTDNFSTYRVPRLRDVPELEIVLLNRTDLPSVGGSETPIIAVAPAIANAIAHASGVRSRSLPLKLA